MMIPDFIRINIDNNPLDHVFLAKRKTHKGPTFSFPNYELYLFPSGKALRIEANGDIKKGWYKEGNADELQVHNGPIVSLIKETLYIAYYCPIGAKP